MGIDNVECDAIRTKRVSDLISINIMMLNALLVARDFGNISGPNKYWVIEDIEQAIKKAFENKMQNSC